jgi:fatty acid synthase
MYTANGFVRSEAICAIFLQRACDAKRVYATVLNSRSNSDGYKEEGIFHPSGNTHILLLDECYQECGADMNLLEYFEGHGTGTKVSSIEGQMKALFSLAIH